VKGLAIASSLLVTLAAAPAAQQPMAEPVQGGGVFRTSTNLVALNVTVTDPRQQYVTGLKLEDFAVFEDGVQQQIQFFEATEVPIDLIVLLDASSSMSDKMDVVQEAAVGFLKSLRPADRGAIVTFADQVDILQPLTSDRDALEKAVRSTRARGATSLHNAIYIALKQFGRPAGAGGEVRRQALAVLSDGQDTASLVSFDDVLTLARKSGVSVYTIALQSKYVSERQAESRQRRSFSDADYGMKMLAAETGAQAFFPAAIHELKRVYASISGEIASQYSLAYAPANPRADGRYRRIVVRVASQPQLRLRTRTGYTPEASRANAALPPQQPRR
jgi:Ca-activated chloride channel family protein